jgi:hypothetical protein
MNFFKNLYQIYFSFQIYKYPILFLIKKSAILLAIKCAALLYVLAFTSIDDFKKGKAATPLITKGNC